jgi:hypothetical protein
VVSRFSYVERVLAAALHDQRSHFIATASRSSSGDSPNDGFTLDRWMADVLGPSGKQSGLITLLQEQNQIWIYFSLRIPLTCLYGEA